VKGIQESVKDFKVKLDMIATKVGLEPDNSNVKAAMDAVQVLVNYFETYKKQLGGKNKSNTRKTKSAKSAKSAKSNKYGGTNPGQYAINNIYTPELNNSVTIGGKKSRKMKGGVCAYASADTNYTLLENSPLVNTNTQDVSTSTLTSSSAPVYAPITTPTTESAYVSTPETSSASPSDSIKVMTGGKKSSKKLRKAGGDFGLPGDLHNILSPMKTPDSMPQHFGGTHSMLGHMENMAKHTTLGGGRKKNKRSS
jgi:hypothetical protein